MKNLYHLLPFHINIFAPFIAVCLWMLWYNILIYFYFQFIYLFIYSSFILYFYFQYNFNHNWGGVCCCFRGRSLNFTTNLYVNFISIHIPTLHILFSFIPTDHEITHQWSGNPHSWDSIYQHQRKPQRLLVKLLTNKFNTNYL